jgi:hypothetical protein
MPTATLDAELNIVNCLLVRYKGGTINTIDNSTVELFNFSESIGNTIRGTILNDGTLICHGTVTLALDSAAT